MKKLKEKWGINSNYQLLIIFFVFSVTGSLALLIATPLLNICGINKEILSSWIFWPIRILIIFSYLPNPYSNNWQYIWSV